MTDLPPLLRDQRKADAQHLSLLAIFHFVVAGLAIVGIAFVFVHYLFMNTLFTNPKLWAGQKNGGPPPQEFFMIFKWFYVIFGLLLASCSLGNLISGIFIRARKHRLFSLIVAGLNCIHMPFGTVLGVFTLVVLLRDSVRELYEVEKDELKSIAASPT